MQDDKITKELLAALRSGNAEKISSAFELVYNSYIRLVAFVISKYVSEDEDIKDISNDVFVSFFDHADSVTGSVKYYLTVSARNAAIQFSAKRNTIVSFTDEMLDELEDDNSSVIYSETVSDMKKHLSDEEVRIILLHAVYGYSFSEIGKRFSKPEGTVKTAYHRAIKRYRGIKKEESA